MKPVVHLELHTGSLERARAFYAELFGWKEERIDAGRRDRALAAEALSNLREAFGHPALEVADELLARKYQATVLEHARAHAALYGLDQLPVLGPDPVVELHVAREPVRIDIGRKEVVEEAVGSVRVDRHQRTHRDVRPPRHDVDLRRRPD